MNIGINNITDKYLNDVKEFRDLIEVIRNRAELLDEPDRTLIITYLDNNNSFRQIAKLAGINETTVSRRIKKLMRRLQTNTNNFSAKKFNELEKNKRKIVRDHFIKGISLQRLAKKYRMSYYKVRRLINLVQNSTTKHNRQVKERKY